MKNILFYLTIVIMFVVIACAQNPITGKSELDLVSESQMQEMAVTQYQQFLTENKVVASSQSKDADMVKRVGSRIANAVTSYYKSKGQASALEGYKWEYNLVQSNDVNAWCMPGGKIVVYTGILPVTQNEAALAVVVGHEVAHAVLRHGKSRMNQGLLTQLGGTALSVALANKPQATQNVFLQAYGLGSEVGAVLPHSRQQELEADQYGLMYTALAGYNPKEAIPFWERMVQMSNGQQRPPEFMSTHPAEETRIEKLKAYMPTALKYYKPIGK